MRAESISPVLSVIENETFTDLAMRPDMETRVKTPRGWLPISALAQGEKPHLPSRTWLESLIAQMTGIHDWHNALRTTGTSLAFMFPFDPRQLRLRCKVALCADAHGGASDFTLHLRNLPMRIPALPTLGLPPHLTGLMAPSGGLVIITGTVGSGKTTTMASLVQHLNETRYTNVIALESLAEYLYPPGKSMITQRRVPQETPTFLQGIRDALDGQAVDVMMIGEVVDRTTMDAMLRAAESGHLVLATMHARNAAGAISRIVDMFPGDEQQFRLNMLADKLIGVVAQKLLPARSADRYTLAYEILTNSTPAVAEAIRSNNTMQLQHQIQQGAEHGMVTLNQTLKKLLQGQHIDRQTALAATYDRHELQSLLAVR